MEKIIRLRSDDEAIKLYGRLDENLKYAEEHFGVKISARNHRMTIHGEEENVREALGFFQDHLDKIRGGPAPLTKAHSSGADFFHKGKMIRPKSQNQEIYIRAVHEHDIVIAIGPAGTGKTYLAVAMALEALKKKGAERIILTRPAVEAGESLGFLPGDLYAKINPYLRPLYDALYDMMEVEEVARMMQRGMIEIAPLAYMRGRTLNDAFVILDEGQNTSPEQMKMFLTRLGFSSKAVITGDITQIDLPNGKRSGLVEIQEVLKSVKGIAFAYLTEADVVRHPLVQSIVKAYERFQKQRQDERR